MSLKRIKRFLCKKLSIFFEKSSINFNFSKEKEVLALIEFRVKSFQYFSEITTMKHKKFHHPRNRKDFSIESLSHSTPQCLCLKTFSWLLSWFAFALICF